MALKEVSTKRKVIQAFSCRVGVSSTTSTSTTSTATSVSRGKATKHENEERKIKKNFFCDSSKFIFVGSREKERLPEFASTANFFNEFFNHNEA